MIEWLYQTTMILTVLMCIVLLIRRAVSKYLGANVAYWLWLMPLLPLTGFTIEAVPVAILEKIDLADGKILIRVIDNPTIYSITSLFTIEIIWGIGLLCWIVFRFFSWYRFQNHLKRNSTKIDIVELLPETQELINEINVKFYTTNSPQAPFVTGLDKGRIYLPDDFFESYTKTEQLFILKHELIHIIRSDLSAQFIVEIFCAVYWFNPIIHFASSAFRQDQELACDYKVLSTSSEQERLAYGQALIKGLNANILPLTMAFYSYQKQRFNMLEKHTYSRVKNIAGIVLCSLLGLFVLTKASITLAIENKSDNKVSFKFKEIELESVIKLVSDANQREITGYENVPDIKISVDAMNVSAQFFEILLLKCSGLKMVSNGSAFKIEKRKKFEGTAESMNECLQEVQDKKFTQLVK